jgi:3,4-dihydroxy 2-butanone 4-phosphate synthase/GTP cyclohydrolase II
MFNTVEEAIEEIKKGNFVIVVDDEDRENEGDLVMAAEKVTPEAINFMAKYARGLICLPLTEERIKELNISDMVVNNQENMRTAFTVSIDAREGITTGISAYDRAYTIKKVIDKDTKPEDIVSPGHIFPLRAKPGGVLVRAGHTEAAVDLAKLAGLYPAGVICEIMNDDGTMARVPQLLEFAKKFNFKIITIESLIRYRRKTEKLVRKVAETFLPTQYGDFKLIAYESLIDQKQHLALVKGEVASKNGVLVRVHSQCVTGDVFKSKRCDCGAQLEKALKIISQKGEGVLLYMCQEGRGIGLLNKIKCYELQDKGKDTVEANQALGFPPDLREYGTGAQILADLGLREIKLLTNNPRKVIGIEGFGLKVIERIPLEVPANENNLKYLRTKKQKLGHLLKID